MAYDAKLISFKIKASGHECNRNRPPPPRRNLINCCHCPLPVRNLKSGGGMGTSSITGTPCQSGEGKGHPRSRGDLDLTRLSVETSNHRLGLRWMLIGHCRWSPTIIGSIWGMVQPWHVTKARCSTVLTFETATFWLAWHCTVRLQACHFLLWKRVEIVSTEHQRIVAWISRSFSEAQILSCFSRGSSSCGEMECKHHFCLWKSTLQMQLQLIQMVCRQKMHFTV